jgi:restriction endonuclease S subunit
MAQIPSFNPQVTTWFKMIDLPIDPYYSCICRVICNYIGTTNWKETMSQVRVSFFKIILIQFFYVGSNGILQNFTTNEPFLFTYLQIINSPYRV